MIKRKTGIAGIFVLLPLLTAGLAVFSLSLGSVRIPPLQVISLLLGQGGTEEAHLIVLQLRLPRIAAALLIGSALAVAGALLQGVVRNPLASPDLLGVTGGASVAVVAFMTFSSAYSIHWAPLVAVAGAFGAAALNYIFAWSRGVSIYRLVLIGIGLSTAAGAMTTFLLISGPAYLAAQVLNWLTGSLYGTNWTYISALLPWMAILLPAALFYGRELNIQALGEQTAAGLGSRVQLTRLMVILCSTALAGAAVGVAGMLSFIGLLAPHTARGLVGSSYTRLIPAAAFIGAIILLLADLAGQMLLQPLDLPAGVFTAAVGAPLFLYLLFRRRAV